MGRCYGSRMIPPSDPKIVARAIELTSATTPHKKTLLRVILSPIPEFLFVLAASAQRLWDLAGEAHGQGSRGFRQKLCCWTSNEESGSANSAHGHETVPILNASKRIP